MTPLTGPPTKRREAEVATTTIEALKKKHNRSKNVRKALNVLAFVAPITTAVPEALTDTGGNPV